MAGKHIPVLLQESVEALDLGEGEIFLDGTLGGGGHSGEVLRRFRDRVRVIGIDQDPESLSETSNRLGIEARAGNFKDLDKILSEFGIQRVDAILFDLGFSSIQLEESGRGFSFQKDEPLDMRMSDQGLTAAQILNSWDEHAIELILRGFGEERHSRKIAREIVERRITKPFKTTRDLVEMISQTIPTRKTRINPATKTFQALRIAVNEELSTLETGLAKGFEVLKNGGRFVVISFHSLEDRIVKNFFRDLVKSGVARPITKKPLRPSEEEINTNPRSRSAKLRVIQKI